MGSEYFGLRRCSRSLSTLYAEMECLLWAASCMRDMRITSIRFETDCSDLVDMTTNPVDWPTFTTEIEVFHRLHEDFEDVSISHIPRSRNGRADALAKKQGAEAIFFLYRSDLTRQRCFSENRFV